MATSIIGRLGVLIEGNTGPLSKSLKRADRKLRRWGRKIARIGAVSSAAIVGVGAAMLKVAKDMATQTAPGNALGTVLTIRNLPGVP